MLIEHEALARFSVFAGLFLVLAGLEAVLPRRKRRLPRSRRWVTNWAIVIIDTVTLRFVAVALPLLAVGAAMDAERQGWGLFQLWDVPGWVAFVLVILILDIVIWLQHWLMHKVPILWRLHRVHHADTDMDVTTALRFHPIEIALSMLLKIGAVYALGADPVAVIVFEMMLNGSAMFNHSNLRLSQPLDRLLRVFIVTPDMHRVHHSVDRAEHDRNFGFALSIWDRLFGTYLAQPRDGHDRMQVGLQWQDARPARLGWSLKLPFLRE